MTGTYVSIHLTQESEDQVRDFLDSLNIPDQPYEPLHTSIVYSKNKIDWNPHLYTPPIELNPTTFSWEIINEGMGILALRYTNVLVEQREVWGRNTYNYNPLFENFKPHISMSFRAKCIDIDYLPIPDFSIFLDCEVIEDLYLDQW